jgi:hypothetical protein
MLTSTEEERNDGRGSKCHNEELRDLYYLPRIMRIINSRRLRWVRHVARMVGGEELKNVYRLLVGKPEVGEYINMDLVEIGWGGVV